MTATRSKMKVDATAWYVAWQGASGAIDGVPYGVSRGDRLRGDSPFVRIMGEGVFVPEDTPQDQWPSPFDESISIGAAAATAPPARPCRIDPQTVLADLLICTQGILNSSAGPCSPGRIVDRTDPIVAVAPECFRPLQDTLGA